MLSFQRKRTFLFSAVLLYNIGKGGGNAMKYVKQPKRHIYLDDFEWRALVKGINEYRKQVIDDSQVLPCAVVMTDFVRSSSS